MLRIEVPSNGPSGLTFSKLEKYEIPSPEDGFNTEVNDVVVLQFEDEQDAIDYSHEIDEYAESLNDSSSAEYIMIRDIINAISNDEFVQAYIQS
jgi:hypothetical protein